MVIHRCHTWQYWHLLTVPAHSFAFSNLCLLRQLEKGKMDENRNGDCWTTMHAGKSIPQMNICEAP